MKVPIFALGILTFTNFSPNCCLSFFFCRYQLSLPDVESKCFRFAEVMTHGREYGVIFSKYSRPFVPFKFKTDRKDICQGRKS